MNFQEVETMDRVILTGTETTLELGYTSLVVLGAQRMLQGPDGCMLHLECLDLLLSSGAPASVEDLVGLTSLHHAAVGPTPKHDLVRCLLVHGANTNHRNRYGEVCILAGK